jgi:hypothetical protein
MKQKKANPTSEVSIEGLAKAILDLHGCKATWIESVPVKEVFKGETVWEGVVQVFKIEGHPKADKCYAWSAPIENSKNRRYYAILHISPINSPKKAIMASIIQEYKIGKLS